jgi:hypothetical protein
VVKHGVSSHVLLRTAWQVADIVDTSSSPSHAASMQSGPDERSGLTPDRTSSCIRIRDPGGPEG